MILADQTCLLAYYQTQASEAHSTTNDGAEEPGERDSTLCKTVGESNNVWRRHCVLPSALSRRGTYDQDHDSSVGECTTAIPHSSDDSEDCTLAQCHMAGRQLTSHDQYPPIRIRRSNVPQQGQTEVGGDIQETSQSEHLEVVEFTKRGTEPWVEVELIE